MAAAPPSVTSVDAPARAAESAAVCAEVRAAQFSPTSTTSAANASSSVRDSATVMATLPRSEPPRSRDIVAIVPDPGSCHPVRDEVPITRSGDRSLAANAGEGGAEALRLVAAGAVVARHLVGPVEQPAQVRVGRGRGDARGAEDDLPARPAQRG